MQLAIRRARRSDAEALTRVAHAAKRFWGYSAKLMRLWEADLTVTPEFVAGHPVYCATHEGAIVGFYAVSGGNAIRELEHLWIHPECIGAGVGRLLFSHLLGHLRRKGVARLMIASDPNAEGFYRRLGARRVGMVASRPAGRRLPLLVVHLRPRAQPGTSRHPRPRTRDRPQAGRGDTSS